MAVQKSFAVTAILCVCLQSATTTPPVLERLDEAWVKEALDVVLAEASLSHCSLIFIMDKTSSYFYEALRIRVSARKTGGDVVFDVADDRSIGVNLTMTQVVAQARKMQLMSWCTLVVVFSDNSTFLSVFAEIADKGRLMVWETKLLVITRLPLSNLQDLLQNCWTFSMMNTMFLELNTSSGENHCRIYGHMPYGPNGSHVAQLASLNSGHVLVNLGDRTLFPEKYNNFHGMKVNLTWIPLTPYWMVMKRPGPNGTEVTTFSGREYCIMENIALILNFSLNPLPYTGWDPMNKSGKDKGPGAWLVMKQVLGTLLDEAIPGELPQRSTTRVVLTAWLIFSFVVGTVYRSNLTASLTIPKYPPRIETFSGLVDANTKQVDRAFFIYLLIFFVPCGTQFSWI
uniref:Ionotropic glutamate receptor C-terminal domain-containing protein n=1 Tax=Scylla olivacea TaxID=85551 RepID=A0A0P4W7L5_SCYOL